MTGGGPLVTVNPKPFLDTLKGHPIAVRLKWGQEYRGVLSSYDTYMNLQLCDASEYLDGELQGSLGEVLIRCNNVLFVRGDQQHENDQEEDQMNED